MASISRRDEIVAVSCSLLEEHRVDQLSTRLVARAVGISQPGLFRHFRSREEILLAVVERARLDLAGVLEEVVSENEHPLDVVFGLLAALLGQVERQPGLPRLFFHDVASGSQNALRASLAHLASAQEGFVAEMVREAVRERSLPSSVDPSRAGKMFGVVLQGFVLQWLRAGAGAGLAESAPYLFSFWRAGLQEGEAASHQPHEVLARGERLVQLDVRPLIRDGIDPLRVILQNLSEVDSRGLLILRAPFRPVPLLALLSKRGHALVVRDHADRGWEVFVSGKEAPPLLEFADLPAPEPLERLLEEVEELDAGDCLLAHTPKVPHLLLEALKGEDLVCVTESAADGTGLVWIGAEE